MIYMDLEKIYQSRDIPNKYILALVLAARARQLSERKAAAPTPDLDEKYISMALEELKAGKINYRLVDNVETAEAENDEQSEEAI